MRTHATPQFDYTNTLLLNRVVGIAKEWSIAISTLDHSSNWLIQTLPPSNGHAITLHVALADPHRPDGKSLDLMMELHPLASYAIAGQAAPE